MQKESKNNLTREGCKIELKRLSKSNLVQNLVTQIVFFCENEFVKSVYGDLALEKMQQNDSFIPYKRGKLKEAIQEFISKADTKH